VVWPEGERLINLIFFYTEQKDRTGCEGKQMNRNTNDLRDAEI